MKQLLFRIIYQKNINWILRNLNKALSPILPKNIKIPPSGIITIKNDKGKYLKIATNQTNFLTKVIFWEGGHKNFEYTDIFVKLIKKVNSFIDIGANIGYYSLLAAHEKNKINIVAFEPATGPLFYLRKNIQLNNFLNIQAESVALSNKNGDIDFYEVSNDKYKYLKHNLAGESNMGSKTKGRTFKINSVKTITLDDYVIRNRVENIDLIKMDTEGTENLILEGAKHLLEKEKPIVICETLFNCIERELENLFSRYDYEFYNHIGQRLVKRMTIVRETDDGVRNCFFVHPDKYHLIEEFVEVL